MAVCVGAGDGGGVIFFFLLLLFSEVTPV